jgi:hypothetical protein
MADEISDICKSGRLFPTPRLPRLVSNPHAHNVTNEREALSLRICLGRKRKPLAPGTCMGMA